MPANTLLTSTPIVRLAEDVEAKIYNFRPTDAPLISSIGSTPVTAVLHEWTADTYRTPNAANAAAEGADATYAAQVQPVTYGNRTQIIQDTVSVSNTAEAVKKYGRAKEATRLITKKMIELKRDYEAAAISSPTAVTASGATAGRMRGLYGWIATNNTFGVGGVAPNPITNVAPTAGTLAALTEANFQTVIRLVYENGGDASVALVSPQHKTKISTFTGNVQRTNEVNDISGKDVKLQASFSIYGHDFGETKIVPNRVMTGAGAGLINTVYIIDYDKIKRGVLRGMEKEQMAVVGDSTQWQVRTEVTLVVGQESALGAVRDVTTTGS